jgi:hypothetical protein
VGVLAGGLEAHDDGTPLRHPLAGGRDLLVSRRRPATPATGSVIDTVIGTAAGTATSAETSTETSTEPATPTRIATVTEEVPG